MTSSKLFGVTSGRAPRDWDHLPSLAMTPVYEPFSYRELVKYMCAQAPDKQLVCVVPYGWGTTQEQAFRDIELLYEFADDPKLVMMCVIGPRPTDIQVILRGTFMRESVTHVEATTFRDLVAKLSDLARDRGLRTTTRK